MKFTISSVARWSRFVVAAFVMACIGGCGAILTLDASRDIYNDEGYGMPGKNNVTKPDGKDDWFLVEMSTRFGLMALFALTSYRYDLSRDDRDKISCGYLAPDFTGDKNFGMPKTMDLNSNSKERWERWVPRDMTARSAPPCLNKDGLFYETYVHRDSKDDIVEAVISYRGTENRKGQWSLDWGTNLASAFGFEPREYAIARENLKSLTTRLLAEVKALHGHIYVVGHSLGGGLAQQAGYLSKDIAEVYTFDTSPVTNWTHLRLLGLIEQGYPVIHRVNNGGEALAGIRALSTATTSTRFGRHDVVVQFGEKAVLSGHLMGVLACNFAKLLSETKATGAAHFYPSDFIDRYVLKPAGETMQMELERRKEDIRVCDEETVSH